MRTSRRRIRFKDLGPGRRGQDRTGLHHATTGSASGRMTICALYGQHRWQGLDEIFFTVDQAASSACKHVLRHSLACTNIGRETQIWHGAPGLPSTSNARDIVKKAPQTWTASGLLEAQKTFRRLTDLSSADPSSRKCPYIKHLRKAQTENRCNASQITNQLNLASHF